MTTNALGRWVLGVLAAGLMLPPPAGAVGPPRKILFDSDMGSDCDDAGALALLHTYADEGKAEIIGCVYSSGKVPYEAAVIEAGTDVLTGRSLAQTPPGNIVRTVYRDWLWNHEQKTLEDQRPSWDLIAALFAVEGRSGFLVDVGDGRLDFDLEKGYRWEPGPGPGDHTLLVQRPGVNEKLAAFLNERLARTPDVHRER